MHHMKKITTSLLIFFLLLTMVTWGKQPVAATEAQQYNQLSDFDYAIEAGEITIVGYVGEGGKVLIAPTYMVENELCTVTIIDAGAFEAQGSITYVELPNTLKSVGEYAFYDCKALKTVVMNGAETEIDTGAFGLYYINRREDGMVEDFGLVGHPGSTAEAYAKEYGFEFSNISSIAATIGTKNYSTLAQAVNAAESGSLLLLKRDISENLVIEKDITLDLNGYDVAGTISVADGYALTVKDSQTDDYTVENDFGYGKLLEVAGCVRAAEGYLQVAEADGLSFHRVDLSMTSVVVRPDRTGIYYSGAFCGDEIVAANVASFGVVLRAEEAPDAAYMKRYSTYSSYCAFKAGAEGNSANGVLLKNILKADCMDEESVNRLKKCVYGSAYILTTDGAYLFGESVDYSLEELLEIVEGKWDELDQVQQTAVEALYERFESFFYVYNLLKNAAIYYQEEEPTLVDGETTAVPDDEGYYEVVLQLICGPDGGYRMFRTKDTALMTKIDAFGNNFICVATDGREILAVGSLEFSDYQSVSDYIYELSDSGLNGDDQYKITQNTKVYDATREFYSDFGSETALEQGDYVICLVDADHNIEAINVQSRYHAGTGLYYNKTRLYDGDDYYPFYMLHEGEEVWVQTKDSWMDDYLAEKIGQIVALDVSDGYINSAYAATSATIYSSEFLGFDFVNKITENGEIGGYSRTGDTKKNNPATYKLAENCEIYNVSDNYISHCGETTTLQLEDQIRALCNAKTGEITHIWVVDRKPDTPLYFHVNRKALVNGQTQRVPNAEGYYEVELFADGQIKTYRTWDIDIMTAVDRYGSESFFTLKLDGDIILAVDAATTSARAASQVASFYDITAISNKTITAERKRLAQFDTGARVTFNITDKTKIYDVCYYSENQFREVELKEGDRISVYADLEGNISYIFVMYPHTREKGYMSECSHCNEIVWWEPYLGSFIATEETVHYYYPTDYTRSQGTMGKSDQSLRYNAVFDLNGCTLSSTHRNFLVYGDLTIIDSVGGGVLEARGYYGGNGGNFMVVGGSVTVNDGVTLRMLDDPESSSSKGGNFYVSNQTVGDKTYIGKVTINDAKLEGWPNSSGNFYMSDGTSLKLDGGSVAGGNIELVGNVDFTWKNTTIDSNITVNGGVLALEGIPALGGMVLNSNGGKVDISKLSTDARIKVLPTGVFTTESDNIDAYLDVFVPAASTINIIKEGKALSASVNIPTVTEDLQFVPGTQMAVCPACEEMVTWTPITQAEYGEKAFGTAAIGQHIYLAEDIVWTNDTTNFMTAPTRVTTTEPGIACFHLNGHNFTATSRNVIHGGFGILNVMGSGVVSGNATNGATVTINTNLATGCINLMSGTFTKAAGNKTGVVQINDNGGTVWVGKNAIIATEEDELAISVGTSNLIPSVLGIYGTVKGGYVQMADANPSKGFTNTFVLDGGNVEGGIKLAKTNIIGLGGAAKVGGFGLDLTSGAKILVSELTEGASVAVAANGVFTETIDAEGQKVFYTAAPKYNAIEVVGQTLSTTRDPNAPPDLPKDPATPALPALLQVDNSNLVLNANNEALCPVCNKTVVWTAITDASDGVSLESQKHYYLAKNITYYDEDAAITYENTQQKVTCLHLNGHNITATYGMAIYSGGYLNVMGNGIVSGNGTTQHRGATLDVNAATARLNLYGGTYMRDSYNTTNVIVNVHGNGGQINLFDDAVIDATNNSSTQAAVRSWCGAFNMYGGLVKGGKGTVLIAANWTTRSDGTGSGTIKVFGGKVQSGTGYAISASGSKQANGSMALATLAIYGGEIRGTVTYNANTTTILAGNLTITKLLIPSNKNGELGGKLYLGELTEGASIIVYGDGVFTFQSENVETYKQYFKAESGKAVVVSDYALAVAVPPEPEPEEPALPDDPKVPAMPTKLSVNNSNLVLDGNNQAKCPVCEKVVTWTAITEAPKTVDLVGDTHYYLANNITYEGTGTAISMSYNRTYTGKPSCLHLNGKNLTATNGIAIFVGMELNVMGSGIVKGNKNASGRAATLEINSSAALLNVYGGTYTKSSGNGYATVQINAAGGILNFYQGATVDNRNLSGAVVSNYNGTVNVYGGEFFGGDSGPIFNVTNGTSSLYKVTGQLNIFGGLARASRSTGMTINGTVDIPAKVAIYGGEIRGSVDVKANVEMIVGGTAVMNGLRIADGVKITLAEMSEGASITLSANGIFTNPSKNAATYVKYFHGLTGYKTPAVVENALFTEQGTEPEQPKPEEPKFDNSNLVFEAGTNKAKCPVCEKVVEWTAITQASNGTTPLAHTNTDGMHYYLAEDITYTGENKTFIQGPGSSKTLCIHLNGHNWTGNATFLFGYGSKSRVMGNGIVSGGRNEAKQGLINWNASTKTNVDIQLYGGTYAVGPANENGHAISINNNGGDITIHEGVTVIGSATAPAIYVGTSNMRTSVLTIKGATVYGTVKIANCKDKATYATTVVAEDTKLNVVELGKDVSFTVKGNTTIEKLIVTEGAKFTVGELGAKAKINVQGNGVLTEASANVTAYKDQIISTYGCELTVKDNVLSARDLNKLDNSNLIFAEGSTKAVCPYCQVEVEWEAISDDSATFSMLGKKHYYLAKDLNFSSLSNTGTGLMYDVYGLANMTCLHLNGHNIISNGRAIYPGGYLNIMGNGIVSGNYTHATAIRGATLDVNGAASSRLNLFGGTYTKAVDNVRMPVMAFFTNGGNINMYAGVTIDGTNTSVNVAGSAGCLVFANAAEKPGNFTMYGGTIQNGTNSASHGGNVYVNAYGNFTMYGGTISGGASPIEYGGNIFSKGTLNLLGGSILNGNGRMGGNIATLKDATAGVTPVVNLKNVVISGGWGRPNADVSGSVAHGGNISIERTTMTIEDGTVIKDGDAGTQGGNLRALYCDITMNGGYIYGGKCGSGSTANVWVVGSASEQSSFTMNGGVIIASSDKAIGRGNALSMTANTTLTFAGPAMVISNPENPNKPVCIDGTLVKDPSWTGFAVTNKD